MEITKRLQLAFFLEQIELLDLEDIVFRTYPERSCTLNLAAKTCTRSPGTCNSIRKDTNLFMLPSKKTLFPAKQSMLLPPDFTT